MPNPTSNAENDWLTSREVSELAGVSERTVQRWSDTGVLRADIKTPGGHRRYRRSSVSAFLTSLNNDAQAATA